MAAEAVTFSLTLPARTLRAVPAENGVTQWIAGTTSLREENEVRLLEYDPVHDQLVAKASWVHPEEVWDISCCPGHAGTFLTAHAKVGVYGATLWQASDSSRQLSRVADLAHEGVVRRVLWSQHNTGQLLTVEEGALRTWSMADAAVQVTDHTASVALVACAANSSSEPGPELLLTLPWRLLRQHLQLAVLHDNNSCAHLQDFSRAQQIGVVHENNQHLASPGNERPCHPQVSTQVPCHRS
eukprot:GHRQ01028174.1.p1 GENE.GHRQ01028174.1~~GHRQ01028174.1.p1  ORF type:complete len:248 (+),score=49.95 GHRQ01028174.1:24-746(+)